MWRTFDFGASYFGAKLCFVSLAWIWVGKACSGKYDKKNKKWKTDSQEIPTTVIKKMDTGVYWVFVYLQVLIKLMKIEVFVTSDQIFFLTSTQISRNVYFKDFYFQFNEWLFYNIYVLFAEHLKWFASVRILDFTSHNWEFFFFTYMYIIFFYPEILRSYCWLYCKKVDFEEKKIIKKERFPISPK